MSAPIGARYDRVPYVCMTRHRTHPSHLAAVAVLHGLEPSPVDSCRVLEIGCADGSNLIPMAVSLPGGRFLGIDLSDRELADGRETLAALQLPNIELRHLDLMAVDDRLGKFDFIIAHGLFSWVPPPVQEKLLSVCSRNLAENGVAFISYNTQPRWQLRFILRDMLLYHSRKPRLGDLRVEEVRPLLAQIGRLLTAFRPPENSLPHWLKEQLELFQNAPESYVFHDLFAEINEPCLFAEFVERTAIHGLQYVAEAEPDFGSPESLPPDVLRELRATSDDRVWLEQNADFLLNRGFRHSLLCHRHLSVERRPSPQRLASLYVETLARPVEAEPDVCSAQKVEFKAPDGGSAWIDDPLGKAAFLHLCRSRPRSIRFPDLVEAARRMVNPDAPADPTHAAAVVGQLMLECFFSGMDGLLDLYAHPAPLAAIAARPMVSPVARLRAVKSGRLPNLRHRSVKVDEQTQVLVPLLDGSRDRAAVMSQMAAWVADGSLEIKKGGGLLQAPEAIQNLLGQHYDQLVENLYFSALLVG